MNVLSVVVRSCRKLSDLHRQHRNRLPINARDWKADTFAGLLGGKTAVSDECLFLNTSPSCACQASSSVFIR
jgi:hypothetical protein